MGRSVYGRGANAERNLFDFLLITLEGGVGWRKIMTDYRGVWMMDVG